jgi:hypothetical protein
MYTKFIHHQKPIDSPMGNKRFMGFTAAYQVVDSKLVVGLAICNEDDVFSKKMGRTISEGRMKKCPHIVPLIDEESPAQAVREFATELYYRGGL